MTRFGWPKVLKFHPVLLFSCLLHGQILKLAEVYLNPNLAKSCFGWAKRLIFLTKTLNRISGLNENDNLEINV